MSNAARFIDAYNRVDKRLEGQASDGEYVSFAKRVRSSKLLVSPTREFLLDFGDLRNVIVHTRGSHTGNPIADPRIDVVEKFEQIAEQLENPPKVVAVMPHQQVHVLDEESDIAVFLDLVREHNFSQAPVRRNDGTLELITTNAVTRWLASEYQADSGAAFEHASLGEVLEYSEADDHIVVRSRETTIVEAWRIFAGLGHMAPPHAIVITHSGRVSEKPLSIVVRSDLPELLSVLL